MDWYKEVPQLEKHIIDIISVGTVVGTVTNALPAVAALMTVIWTAIRVWETETVRKITGRYKEVDNGKSPNAE